MTDDEPKPIPRKTPKKKSDGPSMREQILARRREAEGDGEATPKKAAAAPRKAAAGAPKAAAAGGRPASRTSARRAGGSSRRGGADEGDEDAPRAGSRRRERPVKKKSPIPMIAAAVVVVGGGIGGYFAMTGGSVDASETDGAGVTDETTATADATATDATAMDGAADAATTDDVVDETTGTEDTAANEAAAAKPKPKPAEIKDVDLSVLEPFGAPAGATAEEWAKLQEDAAMFFDIDAGAAGGRAKRRLEAAGKNAWPAILNEMIKLDPANADDNQQGMLGQRALNAARGSETAMAFDWRTPDDSASGKLSDKNLRYNRKLIKALYDSWARVVEDPTHWDRLDKAEAQAEAKASAEKKVDDEFDIGDFDIDDIDG